MSDAASPTFQRAMAAGKASYREGWSPVLAARAPGRIEVIGNHVDYNGGPVLAAAIDRDLTALLDLGGRQSRIAVAFADVADGVAEITIDACRDWRNTSGAQQAADYVRGVVAAALARGEAVRGGARIAVAGDVPLGLGLSSSAAFCVALTLALHPSRPTGSELVLRAQEAEHRAGTPCGTMDQSASVAGQVIRFNGATLAADQLDPDLDGYLFAVVDSGVSRALAHSSYPRRVEESRAALVAANAQLETGYAHLAEIPPAALGHLTERSVGAVSARRIRHIVTEVERVERGVAAMAAGDWPRFGALMTASGRSSAVDYEISHPRVEELVACALATDGVAGARMMGGGEGGAALLLLRADALESVRVALDAAYFGPHGLLDRSERLVPCRFAPGAELSTLA